MNEERFFRAYKALKDIETADDLRRAGLTLAEFREAQYCLQKYAQNNGEGRENLDRIATECYRKFMQTR